MLNEAWTLLFQGLNVSFQGLLEALEHPSGNTFEEMPGVIFDPPYNFVPLKFAARPAKSVGRSYFVYFLSNVMNMRAHKHLFFSAPRFETQYKLLAEWLGIL